MVYANKHRQALRAMLVLCVHLSAQLNTRYVCSLATRYPGEVKDAHITSKIVSSGTQNLIASYDIY
jgi:hypothetical protein